MSWDAGIVIVGGGQGGFQVAASLRDEGYDGPIRIIGDEAGFPYQRPPLSKAYMLGKTDADGLDLRAPAFYADRRIDILAPERAVSLDRAGKKLLLASGKELAYGHLVLATGTRNRLLPVPGAEQDGVFYLRTREDADRIRARLNGVQRAVVIGAGFIGLEFAAVAASLGIEVAVIEAADRPMARALSRPMSMFFRNAHEAAGLRFVFGSGVTRVVGEAGRVSGVETVAGEVIPAEIVIVGIGVIPNAELAEGAGLSVHNGIRVDTHLSTDDDAISAIGDCVAYPSRFAEGAVIRLESVQNAVDQARAVAARLSGKALLAYDAVPWFWSDQGKLKLQMVGLTMGHDETVLRGDPAGGAFSVFCYRANRLVGVESVNKPADHMIARRLLAKHLTLSPAEAGDSGLDLKARAGELLAGG